MNRNKAEKEVSKKLAIFMSLFFSLWVLLGIWMGESSCTSWKVLEDEGTDTTTDTTTEDCGEGLEWSDDVGGCVCTSDGLAPSDSSHTDGECPPACGEGLEWSDDIGECVCSDGLVPSDSSHTDTDGDGIGDCPTEETVTTTAVADSCDDYPANYGITDNVNIVCVDPDGTSTLDICQFNTIPVQLTIQDAIDNVPDGNITNLAIFITDGTYSESLNISKDNISFIGCTLGGVIVGPSSSPTVNTHTVDMSGVTNVGFYNMTLRGIGYYSLSGSETSSADAALFNAVGSTDFTVSNVQVTAPYYQAFKIDSSSSGSLSSVDISLPYAATDATSEGSIVGIWNEGNLNVSALTFGSDFGEGATGIVSNGGTLILTGTNSFTGMDTALYFANSPTVSFDPVTLVNSNIVGFFSQDVASLTLDRLTGIDGTNTYDLIACQTTGTDRSANIYELTNSILPTLVFGTVTVTGTGNTLGVLYTDDTTSFVDQFATYPTTPYIVICDRGEY